ncbi:potassium-transporting ATPase subunit C [Enterococcus mundtii]|uniref:potassium-transporting ATPase subunit C n=1 Tax=Enterococcus TaxID=1350 RepID=UPI00044D1073|nr:MULTISPECIES: potassium-transporting ATPase subunit C [Enterococcus]AZP93092.1 potassium-transporting ATPase subunit C [Enterococcus mundtii]EYT96447.1 potassium transporter KtrB [Enterococcus mundtii CRL35]MDA9428633.1 Potassium-transporting ATPase C chain [Enterococcus mundtii 1A]MDK4210670.1 potassium-transporting ATPase subunit C [Enterococcus mundtii]MEC3940359.1 potassium-transporting ATPase subunit C [Enterococcus mundtii]
MKKILRAQLSFLFLSILVLGGLYTVAVTGIGQLFFAHQANGSQRVVSGKMVGSSLIGQSFQQAAYFNGRGQDVTQLSPTSLEQKKLVENKTKLAQQNDQTMEIPIDLVTNSASGVDPHISVAAAESQVSRIAKERGEDVTKIRAIIQEKAQKDWFSDRMFVNVLELNLSLDNM